MYILTHINADNTYSVKCVETEELAHFTLEQIQKANTPILGVLRNKDLSIASIHTVQPDEQSKGFIKLLNYIKSDDVRNFANLCRRIIPKYIFEVAASSTGKYHPASDLGFGGLERHIVAVTMMMIHMTEIESTKQQFTDREIDCMIVACMLHDCLKSGWQEDFEKSKWTRHEHPMLAANMVRGMIGFLDEQSLEFIAHCIESHMGEWNTTSKSKIVLPKPSDRYQWMVHMADYLASRDEICMIHDNTAYVKEGIETKIAGKSVEKSDVDFNEIDAVQVALDNKLIDSKLKTELGITRTDAEILDIWATIIKTKKASEKQKKYVQLAVGSVRGK